MKWLHYNESRITPMIKNAIKVNNVNGNEVVLIKKDLAAALAYIMDNKLAQIEG